MLIQGGTIIDGTKTKRRAADIRIIGKKIKGIGNLVPRRGEEIIRAQGKFVVPGFIDFFEHKNLGSFLFSHAKQEHFVRQGITTILVGMGGTSLAPLVEPDIAPNIQTNINWRSVKEYLESLSAHKPRCNIGTLIGYETVARVGTREQIYQVIVAGLREGAFGVSFATSTRDQGLKQVIEKNHHVLVHVGASPNFSFPHFLQHNVRENKSLSWEEAIYRITGKRAEGARIKKRGKIMTGYYADIVVFDPMHISDTKGVSRVLVNGGVHGTILKYS